MAVSAAASPAAPHAPAASRVPHRPPPPREEERELPTVVGCQGHCTAAKHTGESGSGVSGVSDRWCSRPPFERD